ncbi:MAG: phosphate ABC transporter substrate-binding protein PstS family protein, partial [Chloroflexota bacterium]
MGIGRNGAARGAASVALAAMLCGGAWGVAFAQESDLSGLTGEIVSDGSSTVGPITQAMAEEFNAAAPDVRISVDISGTGGGFERFCAGETDVQNASRSIKDEEAAACAAAGVEYLELEVAYDGLTVVVNENTTFISCLNVDALKLLWQKDNPAMTWADLNAEWPAETINLYGPGTDSGTFDYFVETILGEDDIREDFTPSEDDNVLVEGVANDENALAYFGHAYFEENQDTLNAVAIDGGAGCVEPTTEAIQDGTYTPLSRPLYVYAKKASLERPEIQEFLKFYIENAPEIAPEVGFVASPDEAYAADLADLEAATAPATCRGSIGSRAVRRWRAARDHLLRRASPRASLPVRRAPGVSSNPATAGERPAIDLTGRAAHSAGERVIGAILFVCGMVSILTTLGIVLILAEQAFEFFREVSLTSFLFGTKWTALFKTPEYGVLPLVAGTLWITLIALLVALPLGLLSAVYLSEYASPRARNVLKPALELLAGVPTIVYGFFAVTFIRPEVLKPLFPKIGPFSALAAGIAVGIMIIPLVASLSEDALRSVPRSLRE